MNRCQGLGMGLGEEGGSVILKGDWRGPCGDGAPWLWWRLHRPTHDKASGAACALTRAGGRGKLRTEW